MGFHRFRFAVQIASALALAATFLIPSRVSAQVTATLVRQFVASDGAATDSFGGRLAISGDRIAIAAASANVGANTDQGAVYVFSTDGQFQTKLVSDDGAPRDQFGASVALSQNRALVGANLAPVGGDFGKAYLFDTTTGQQLLTLSAPIVGDTGNFGWASAISGDSLFVSAIGRDNFQGAVYRFDASNGQNLATYTPDDASLFDTKSFGSAIAVEGGLALFGANQADIGGNSNQGAAYLFDTQTGQQLRKIIADDGARDDFFGGNLALTGNLALVSVPLADINGNTNQGAVYLFDVATGRQLRKLTASGGTALTRFGQSVAVSGDYALIGASGEDGNQGAAYLFNLLTGQEMARLTVPDRAPNDAFGSAVAFSDNVAIVGARGKALNGNVGQGTAYQFLITPAASAPEPMTLAFLLPFPLAFVRRFASARALARQITINWRDGM